MFYYAPYNRDTGNIYWNGELFSSWEEYHEAQELYYEEFRSRLSTSMVSEPQTTSSYEETTTQTAATTADLFGDDYGPRIFGITVLSIYVCFLIFLAWYHIRKEMKKKQESGHVVRRGMKQAITSYK